MYWILGAPPAIMFGDARRDLRVMMTHGGGTPTTSHITSVRGRPPYPSASSAKTVVSVFRKIPRDNRWSFGLPKNTRCLRKLHQLANHQPHSDSPKGRKGL